MDLLKVCIGACIIFGIGCTTTSLRMPASQYDVYKNSDLRDSLKLAASNGILFHLPAETIQAFEKSEIDPRCRKIETPFWSEKLSVYLALFKSRPEFYGRFHILEMRQGDTKKVEIQKDQSDGGLTLSVQFQKSESSGPVNLSTKIPCEGNRAEYIQKSITKTFFDFPSVKDLELTLADAEERPKIDRFSFDTYFLSYLAERGSILKFDHDMSFERISKNRFVMVEVLNQFALDSKKMKNESHLGLWLKKINENSQQAQLIQLFSIEKSKDQKAGIKVASQGEFHRRSSGEKDLTYIFSTYNVEPEKVITVSLEQVDKCLEKLTIEMGPLKFRQPADEKNRDSYLFPGYICKL